MVKKMAAAVEMAAQVRTMTERWKACSRGSWGGVVDQINADAEKARALQEIIQNGKSIAMSTLRERVARALESHGGALTPQQIIFLGGVDQDALVQRALSEAGKKGVAARGDQVMKAEFLKWAQVQVNRGVNADNVDALQGLSGFDGKWSRISASTLKKWAREAGFTFKTGRPKKEK